MSGALLFCPKCQSLLNVENERCDKSDSADITTTADPSQCLMCPTCTYTLVLNSLFLLHSNRIKGTATSQLSFASIFDSTFKRTARIKCPNDECPSLDKTVWGTRTEHGVVIQPDVIVMNYLDADRVATYVCRVCGQVFRP